MARDTNMDEPQKHYVKEDTPDRKYDKAACLCLNEMPRTIEPMKIETGLEAADSGE